MGSTNIYVNCPTGRFHDFRVISSPYTSGDKRANQVEECKLCKEKKTYTFQTNGKMTDDRAYFKDHIRVFAQPEVGDMAMAEVYYECNPGAREKDLAEALAKKNAEQKEIERASKFRWAMGKALRNEGWKDGKNSSR